MMIIVRILFDNLEGLVITSPAIPDKSLIIFLKTEFCDSGKLVNIKDAYHHPLFYKVVCLYMYKTLMNIEVTLDIAEILFFIYKIWLSFMFEAQWLSSKGCDQETGFKTRNILCFPIRYIVTSHHQQQSPQKKMLTLLHLFLSNNFRSVRLVWLVVYSEIFLAT